MNPDNPERKKECIFPGSQELKKHLSFMPILNFSHPSSPRPFPQGNSKKEQGAKQKFPTVR